MLTEDIHQVIASATREFFQSIAQQREQFLGRHLSLAATHVLASYPFLRRRVGSTSWHEQRVALLPRFQSHETWPWERVLSADLPHTTLRFGLTVWNEKGEMPDSNTAHRLEEG